MSPGQMFRGQMSLWQFEFVQEGPRNLELGQNGDSKSWVFADIEFAEVGGVQSHFCVKLNLGYIDLRLGWGFDN